MSTGAVFDADPQ